MTTLDPCTAPPPRPSPDGDAVCADRVAGLLIALERAAPRLPVLRPLADLRPAHDGTEDVIVFATVFVSVHAAAPAEPFALHELRLAAACLDDDPPFPAAPSLSPRLRAACVQAAAAALLLQRSLS